MPGPYYSSFICFRQIKAGFIVIMSVSVRVGWNITSGKIIQNQIVGRLIHETCLFQHTACCFLLRSASTMDGLIGNFHTYMHLLDHCAEDLHQDVLTQPYLCIFRSYFVGPGSSCIIVWRFCNRFYLFTYESLLSTSIRTYWGHR